MNGYGRIAVGVAVSLALALGFAPAPANAVADEYTWLGCAGQPTATTGDLTGHRPGDFHDEAWHGEVVGSIRPCRTPEPMDVYAIASYDTDGTVTAKAAVYPTSHGYTAEVAVRPKTAAVCLIDNLKSRLDCLKVGWLESDAGPARPVLDGHLPLDSPLVTLAPVVTLDGRFVHPGCPTCVQD